jgi:methyltransferase (TIGR00027 family)
MNAHTASATAQVVAAATLLFARENPQNTILSADSARYTELLLKQSGLGQCLAFSTRFAFLRRAWRCLERVTHPGIIRHYALRKRWLEQQTRAAIAQGCEQLLVLGAGLDSLAMRIAAEFPTIDVIELDHPATQTLKQRAFACIKTQAPAQRLPTLRAIDLARERLPSALLSSPLSRVVMAEGVLMYLPENIVASIFQDLASACGSTKVLFSFMPRWSDGSVGFLPKSQLVTRWLQARSEAFQWALARAEMPNFLDAHGFKASASVTPAELSGTDILEGETLVASVSMTDGATNGKSTVSHL